MMTLAMISLLAGMVLGQRFKVLALVPTTALLLLLAVGAGIARSDAVWWIALMATATAVSLQIGYLGGVCIRYVLVAARSPAISARGAAPAARRPAH